MNKPQPHPTAAAAPAPDVAFPPNSTGANPLAIEQMAGGMMDPLAGLVRGRVVLYCPTAGESRHADPGPWASIVTDVQFDPTTEERKITGVVTLNVMPPVPCMIGEDPVSRRKDVPFSPEGAPGSWRWLRQ